MRGRLVADKQGRYLDADVMALELLGLTLDEIRAMRIGDLSGPNAEMAAVVWRRLAATGQDMSSGEATLYLPNGSEIRVRYLRIGVLEDGSYELVFEPVAVVAAAAGAASTPARPPSADRPSLILKEWRNAEREAEAAASGGPGAMAAPDEASDAVDKLRRLYQDSVVARTEAPSES